ncbi:MAG: imidazole glycerol phosphate synthase subunit HisH, partial [Methanobacteriota archaeon]
KAVDDGIPFLGLCLGIQVILEESEESPGVPGLGLLSGTCKRFPQEMKVPHMGWNTLEKKNKIPLLEGIETGSYFYFVHSYYPIPADAAYTACETNYGNITFPSVISKDNIHATQFHPERSGEKGLKLLENFLNLTR